MATIPTQDAVPSESPRDLKFNAGKIDEFVTSLVNTYIDRFGHEHYTIEGLKQLVLQHIYNLGWSLKGTFQGGGTVTAAGDLLQDTTSLIWYRWDDLPTLPKTVPSGSTPASAGGTGVGKWQPVDVADVLRKDLAKTTGATLVNTSDNRNVQEWLIALDSAEYRAKNIRNLTSAHYKLRRKSGLKILCQGDSITAGYDVVTPDSIAPGDDTVSTGDTYRHASMTYLCLRTDDFVRELGILNWHFSRKDANEWIERYQNDFADKTPDQSDNRYWMLRNMGRIF